MKIEEEIKQYKFRNEYQKATLNLIYSSNWLLSRHKDFFSKFRITQQQYNVLRILKGQHPNAISTSEIKERMLDMNSDSSRIVDRLALKGIVSKKICKQDKRLVDVSITDKGVALLHQIEDYIVDLDRVISNLSVEEANRLNNLLDKMRGK
jgi:DNA-binding MarR family transcriptional regulator